MLLKAMTTCFIAYLCWYYIAIFAQIVGIIEITGLTKENDKFDKKNLIPFYQLFKMFLK